MIYSIYSAWISYFSSFTPTSDSSYPLFFSFYSFYIMPQICLSSLYILSCIVISSTHYFLRSLSNLNKLYNPYYILQIFMSTIWIYHLLHPAIHGVAKSQTRLSNWTELNSFSRKHVPLGNDGDPLPSLAPWLLAMVFWLSAPWLSQFCHFSHALVSFGHGTLLWN